MVLRGNHMGEPDFNLLRSIQRHKYQKDSSHVSTDWISWYNHLSLSENTRINSSHKVQKQLKWKLKERKV